MWHYLESSYFGIKDTRAISSAVESLMGVAEKFVAKYIVSLDYWFRLETEHPNTPFVNLLRERLKDNLKEVDHIRCLPSSASTGV